MDELKYRFGKCELDAKNKTLCVDGTLVHLGSKPFELLLLLVRHAGRTVTREQAIAALWPNTTVHANSLAVAANNLRGALQRTGASLPIETVPRRGYRLSSPVALVRALQDTQRSPHEPRAIVGRALELARLHALFDEACAGRGALVCVTGEAGIGKTALIERARWELAQRRRPLLAGAGKCVKLQAGVEDFAPVIGAVSELLRGSSSTSVAEVLAARCPHWCLHHPGSFSDHPSIEGLQREGKTIEAAALMRQLCDALFALAAHAPLLLLLEDLQWADPASLDLVRLLASRLSSERVLLIITLRAAGGGHAPQELNALVHRSAGERAHVLSLRPLDEAEVQQLIEREQPGLGPDTAFVRSLWSKSEGLPLFVVRLLQAALQSKAALSSGPGEHRPDLERTLAKAPASVTGFIRQQLVDLPAAERELLDVAAVLGEEFRANTLARVLDTGEAGVEGRLESLESARQLVTLLREEELCDGQTTARYRFCHALVQAELYAQLGVQRRLALHSRVAEALDVAAGRLPARGDHIYDHRIQLERAHHFCAARRYPEAVLALLRAGDYCDRRFAKREALVYYERAIELLPKTTGAERLMFRLLASQAMGWSRFGLGDLEQARAAFRDARHCAGLLEAKESVPASRTALQRGFRYLDIEWEDPLLQRPRAMLADHAIGRVHVLRAEAYFGECAALASAERYRELIEVAGELLALALETSNEHRQAEALGWLGAAQLELGQLAEAERTIDECLTLSSRARHQRSLDMATYARATLHLLRGELERAAEDLARFRERAVLSHGAARCLADLGDLHAKQGRIQSALRYHDESSALLRASDQRDAALSGWIHRELGSPRRALELDSAALDACPSADRRRRRALSHSLAASYARVGDLPRARSMLESARLTDSPRDSFINLQHNWQARCEIHEAAAQHDIVEQVAAHWYGLASAREAREGMMQALGFRARAAFGRRQLWSAREHVLAALTLHARHPQPLLALRLMRSWQQIEAARGDRAAVARAARAGDALFATIDGNIDTPSLRQAFRQSPLAPASSARSSCA